MPLLLIFFFFFFRIETIAQSSPPEFGVFSQEEINLKECPFDKEAEAVILFNDAFSYYDDEHKLITTYRTRIKILTQSGLDRGDIKIPFYTEDEFEFIRNIEGVTYNPNDRPDQSYLNQKSIYTEKKDKYYSIMKFALPNVKVGSIIEYKYESVMKHYGGLDHWFFQNDIPTIKSSYLLEIIPNAEFSYVLSKKPNYPVVVKPMPDAGKIYFEMNNIPALRFEPFMDAPKDYLQRVEFQFSGYTNEFGKKDVNTTWKDISYNLSTNDNLGNISRKGLTVNDDFKALVERQTTNTAKLVLIYNYVRNNFTWDGYDSKFAADGLRKVWEKRSGTSGEINLILIKLLQSFDVNASPLLVSERDHGKIDPKIPLIERFNKTVAYAVADGKTFILDATQKFCKPGLTPYNLLNTYALIVDKKNDRLLEIESKNEAYKNQIDIKTTLDANGVLKGTAVIQNDEYAQQLVSERISGNEKKYVQKELEEPHEGLKIDSFAYKNIKADSVALTEHIKFNTHINENGGYLLLNYNLFTGLSKNPFKNQERFTNINFGFPYHMLLNETIELPSNGKVDDLPKNKILETPDKNIVVSRTISKSGNLVTIKIEFLQTITLVPYDNYDDLKEFYKLMIDMLNEPIVVKLEK